MSSRDQRSNTVRMLNLTSSTDVQNNSNGLLRSSYDNGFDERSPLVKTLEINNSSAIFVKKEKPSLWRKLTPHFKVFIYFIIVFLIVIACFITLSVGLVGWSNSTKPSDRIVHPQLRWNQKGITFTNGKYCPWVKFSSDKSDLSLSNLASTGANYVAIIVTQFQDTANSTTIKRTDITATDEELIHAIDKAHSLGLKVMLKPQVDLLYDPKHWRGDIGSKFTDQRQWNMWFSSYQQMILHYAYLAREHNVEQFSLGCELIATSHQEANWRSVADLVRETYDGSLTYAANWGGEETNKTWWDVVDFIGVDAYYPLATNITNPTVPQLLHAGQAIIENGIQDPKDGIVMQGGLRNLSAHWNRPIIFTEVGYCSGECTLGPTVDLVFQSQRYQALFDAFRNETYFDGVFWWNWASDPAFGGQYNYCCTPQNKPSEDVLRFHYGGTTPSKIPEYPPVCPCIL